MYHRLYLHLVWTTQDREPLIDLGVARFLCRFLRSIARRERAYILEIGMVQTHVHLLVRIHPTVNVSRLVQRLKGLSATVANKETRSDSGISLRWSKGYAAKTASPESLDVLRAYLRRQPLHHPDEAIPGWSGDNHAEFDASSRRNLRPERSNHP
jgi:putative transposase